MIIKAIIILTNGGHISKLTPNSLSILIKKISTHNQIAINLLFTNNTPHIQYYKYL